MRVKKTVRIHVEDERRNGWDWSRCRAVATSFFSHWSYPALVWLMAVSTSMSPDVTSVHFASSDESMRPILEANYSEKPSPLVAALIVLRFVPPMLLGLDLIIQRVLCLLGAVDFDTSYLYIDVLDWIFLAAFPVGLRLLSITLAGSIHDALHPTLASEVPKEEMDLETNMVTLSLGVLLVPLALFPSALHRMRCWAVAAQAKSVGRMHASRMLRLGVRQGSLAIVGLVILVVQMHHLQMRHSHGNGDQSLPLLMDVAIRLAEAEGMPKNCPTLVEQYNNMAPCYEVKWIGDPALVEIPVTTSVFAVLSADQQRAAVVMDHCWKPRLQSILSQKAVLLSIATAAIVMYQFVAMRGMLGPLVSLLGNLVRTACHIDNDGAMVAVPPTKEEIEAVTLETAVERIARLTKLMLRAAFQRGGIVRQILRDAQASSAADEGLLMMFGGIEGTPHAKKSSLSAWRSSVVIDGSNASKRNLGQGSSGGTKTADIGARMSLEGRPLGTQRSSMGSLRISEAVSKIRISRKHPPRPGKSRVAAASNTGADEASEASNRMAMPSGMKSIHSTHEVAANPSIGSWTFDVFGLGPDDITEAVIQMFRASGILYEGGSFAQARPSMPRNSSPVFPKGSNDTLTKRGDQPARTVHIATLRNFLHAVESAYLDNPYHRWEHAVDVTQTVFTMLKRLRSFRRAYLSDVDVFCMLMAGIIHDLGHRGVSNAHLAKTDDIMAVTYNDKSIQENYHVSSFFHLCLKNSACNIFEAFPDEDYRRCRTLIVELVLETDMSTHMKCVADLEMLHLRLVEDCPHLATRSGYAGIQDLLATSHTGPPMCGLQMTRDNVRQVMRALLHLADISHGIKPPALHVEWSSRITQEFFDEGRQQRELGMTPLKLMDATCSYVPYNQVEFLDIVVRPLVCVIVQILPELGEMSPALFRNFCLWLSVIRQDTEVPSDGQPLREGRRELSAVLQTADSNVAFRRLASMTPGQADQALQKGECLSRLPPLAFASSKDEMARLGVALEDIRALGVPATDAAKALNLEEREAAMREKALSDPVQPRQ